MKTEKSQQIKFRKLDAIEKLSKKLSVELKKMYDLNFSSEEKYWSLNREKKIRSILKKIGEDYQVILHND